MHKLFPICVMVGYKEDIIRSLTGEKLQTLAQVLIDKESEELLKCMTQLLSSFVVNDYIGDEQMVSHFQFHMHIHNNV